ncbi:MAG: carbon-nitrogen hydrolase family protein [Candidatus Kariarchaeaceae archaeon]|jgi:nitrilase
MENNSVRVAVIQAASAIMNRDKCIEKVAEFTKKAADQQVKIVLFPEAFIPAYPRGLNFGAKVGSRSDEGKQDFHRYSENSISIPSTSMDRLGEIAKENQVYLVVGLIEKDSQYSKSTLYCTIVYFDPAGNYLGKHRKLKPTGSERLIWGEGDGSTLTVIETPYGIVGGLICWENYMPLARTAMYAKGIHIYLAPTADAREQWQSTIRHIALEGRCFVLACNQFVNKEMYPQDLACYSDLESSPEIMSNGGSAIIDPNGNYLAGPLYDGEGILVADLDLTLIEKTRYDFDVVGHYARPDVFQLVVDESEQKQYHIS